MKFHGILVGVISLLTYLSAQAQCDLNFEFTNTGANMTAFLTPEAVSGINAVTESGVIGAFYIDNSGEYICASSINFTGSQVQLPLMADDSTTPEKDGFANGEQIFWFFKSSSDEIFDLSMSPEDNFILNSISIITDVEISSIDCGDFGSLCDALDTDYINTGSNMTLFITPEGAESLSDLDSGVIAIYFTNPSGEVCGGSIDFDGSQNSFPGMGDDATTLVKDGFSAGDQIIWKYQTDNGAQYTLYPSPNDVFSLNAISFINFFEVELVCDNELEEIVGCTDMDACNYNETAVLDDGSCTYPQESIEETFNISLASWGGDLDGEITAPIITVLEGVDNNPLACTDLEQDLSGAIALIKRGSCQFSLKALNAQDAGAIAVIIYNNNGGVMNMGAGDAADQISIPVFAMGNSDGIYLTDLIDGNNNLTATLGLQSLQISSIAYDCNEECANDVDGDGICDELEILGCTDESACNYSASATENDNSCEFAETAYDCNENCLFDNDQDGICDEFEISGCTDSAASNYNVLATDDDDSCEYNYNCGCMDSNFVEYYTQGFVAECDNGSCDMLTESYGLTAEHFNSPMNTSVNMTLGFELAYNSLFEGAQVAAFSDLNGDGIIATDSYLNGFGEMYYECIGLNDYVNGFFVMPLWGDDPLTDEIDGAPLSTQEIIFAILMPDGEILAFNPEPSFYGFEPNGLLVFENLNFDVTIYGCIDSDYCNFNEYAEEDDGSCEGLFGCTEELYVEFDSTASCQLDEACLNTWQSAYAEASLAIEVLIGDNANLQEELILYEQSNIDLNNELQVQVDISLQLEEDLYTANTIINDYESQVSNLLNQISSLEVNLEDATLNIQALEASLSELIDANVELITQNNSLEDALSSVNEQLEGCESQLLLLQDSLSMALLTIDEQSLSIESYIVDVSNLESQLQTMSSSLELLEVELEESNSSYLSLEIDYVACMDLTTSLELEIQNLLIENGDISGMIDSLSSPIFIDLIPGWNIIGFTVKNTQDAVASFEEIVDILAVVKNNAGEVYWPEFGFNGIGDLIPGQGYQIRVDEAYDDFNFQDLNGLRIEIQVTVPQWAIDMETSIHPNDIRTLVRVVNSLGQEVNPESVFVGTLLYYLYNDGAVEKHLK